MTAQEIFAQAIRLSSEERRFLAEAIWETVDSDMPLGEKADANIAFEVARRFEAFKCGREHGLSHAEVFGHLREG